MGLNCAGPLMCGFFSTNTTVLHDPRSVESIDSELWMWRAEFEHQWILVSPAGPGTNLLWIPRDNCTFQRLI